MANPRNTLVEILRKQKRAGKILVCLGVLLLAITAFLFVDARRFYVSATHAQGKIVELERHQSGKDVTVSPVFSFVDSKGASHVIRSRWSNPFGRYAVADTVEVLYPVDEPESARLNDLFGVWGWTLLFGAVGLLAEIAGIVLWYYALHGPAGNGRVPKQWIESR